MSRSTRSLAHAALFKVPLAPNGAMLCGFLPSSGLSETCQGRAPLCPGPTPALQSSSANGSPVSSAVEGATDD